MDYVDEMDFSPLPLNTFPLFDFPTNLPFSEFLKIKWSYGSLPPPLNGYSEIGCIARWIVYGSYRL